MREDGGRKTKRVRGADDDSLLLVNRKKAETVTPEGGSWPHSHRAEWPGFGQKQRF